jgi:predicted RNase H-like HicB family nuclease
MTVNIFLQNDSQKGDIATVLEFPACVAEGKTKKEAPENAKVAMLEKLANGELVSVQIESHDALKMENPWIKNFGRFKSDPSFDDFLAEMEAYRRELDTEEDWSQ